MLQSLSDLTFWFFDGTDSVALYTDSHILYRVLNRININTGIELSLATVGSTVFGVADLQLFS